MLTGKIPWRLKNVVDPKEEHKQQQQKQTTAAPLTFGTVVNIAAKHKVSTNSQANSIAEMIAKNRVESRDMIALSSGGDSSRNARKSRNNNQRQKSASKKPFKAHQYGSNDCQRFGGS